MPDFLRALDLRERSAATIASATATLAEPRDPEMVARAAECQREWERRRAEAAEEAARRAPPAAPVPSPAPAKPPAYATKAALSQVMDNIIEAVAKQIGGMNNRFVLRFREDERRITELEERLARLEGRADG